jgi:hypothetical protein
VVEVREAEMKTKKDKFFSSLERYGCGMKVLLIANEITKRTHGLTFGWLIHFPKAELKKYLIRLIETEK